MCVKGYGDRQSLFSRKAGMPMSNGNASTAQLLELASSLVKNLPKDLPEEVATSWCMNPGGLRDGLRELLMPKNKAVPTQLDEWKKFYCNEFGIELGEVTLPKTKPGFNYLVVVAQGLTLARCYEVFRKHFKVYWRSYAEVLDDRMLDDFQHGFGQHERNADKGSYALWVRGELHPDAEHKGKDPLTIEREQVKAANLLENLLLHLKFYLETDKMMSWHQDTFCVSSSFPFLKFGRFPANSRDGYDLNETRYFANGGVREVIC